MHPERFFRTLCLLFIAAMLLPEHGAAQTFVDPGQLPARTSFYLLWRGTPTGEVRKSNSLYALWDDPQFSSARAALFESFLSDTQSQKNKPAVSSEDLAQYVTLLDNAFLIGYQLGPGQHAGVKTVAAKTARPPVWNGMFFIYDRSGKEEPLWTAIPLFRSGSANAWNR